MNTCPKFFQNKRLIQLSLIIFLCLVTYLPSLGNGFIWDDETNLYKSQWIQETGGLGLIWLSNKMYQYYPVTFTTFWLEHKLWGISPFGYHLVNLLIHILNALLVFWVVRKLYARLAFPVALLFAIHPIQVETVAWITERKNLLSLFFFLSAILAYLRFDRTRIFKYYLLTVALFIFALLSKSIAICFIFFPILYKWWRDAKVTWREIKVSFAFAAIGFLSALYTLYLEFYHVGAQGKDFGLNFIERFILSGRIILFYIYKLIFPFNFMFFYPPWVVDARIWWQWFFPLATILLLSILVMHKEKIGRGAITLFIFYVISIFPVLGFLNVYGMRFSRVADHFSYLSTPALLLLLCAGITFILDRLRNKFPLFSPSLYKALGRGFFIFAIIYMCGEGMALTMDYKNEYTLWHNLIKNNPKAWIAYNNLGTLYSNAGKIEEGIVLFKKALEIKPDYGEAYDNLATGYANLGRTEKALSIYEGMAQNPNFAHAAIVYYRLGDLYLKMSRNTEAIAEYKKAIKLKPDYPEAYNNLCSTYIIIGKNQEALEPCRKAIQLNPAEPQAYYNLGNAYYNIGRKEDAAKAYKEATQISPGHLEAFNNLASVFVEAGQADKAIELWEKAVQTDPNFATAHFNLAVFYFRSKKYDLAIKHCDKVIALGHKVDPKFLGLLKPYRK